MDRGCGLGDRGRGLCHLGGGWATGGGACHLGGVCATWGGAWATGEQRTEPQVGRAGGLGEGVASSALLNHPCSHHLSKQKVHLLFMTHPGPGPVLEPPLLLTTHKDLELTHGAFGGDGHGLQEDLHDPGSDPRRVLVVSVQVVQDLLDHVVRVLSLSRDHNVRPV